MVVSTALSPRDAVVTIACATFDRALDLAAEDLARDWLPVSLALRPLRWDSEQIGALVAERAHERPAG